MTITGCAVDSSPSPSAMTPQGVHTRGDLSGPTYERGINYKKKMDAEEQHYRSQRSAQGQAQEQEREQDPRWER